MYVENLQVDKFHALPHSFHAIITAAHAFSLVFLFLAEKELLLACSQLARVASQGTDSRSQTGDNSHVGQRCGNRTLLPAGCSIALYSQNLCKADCGSSILPRDCLPLFVLWLCSFYWFSASIFLVTCFVKKLGSMQERS